MYDQAGLLHIFIRPTCTSVHDITRSLLERVSYTVVPNMCEALNSDSGLKVYGAHGESSVDRNSKVGPTCCLFGNSLCLETIVK